MTQPDPADAGPQLTNPVPASDQPDPGNTDPAELVAPLEAGDDAVEQLSALHPADDTGGDGDDEQLGY